MGTRWLDDDERHAWLGLLAVTELLPAALDAQLRRDADLTLFEYLVLAMLSEAPDRTLRMTSLAQRTNASLARLSHVARRLQTRGLIDRFPCPEDGRATNSRLTTEGWDAVVQAAPNHVDMVRRLVLDPLAPNQVAQLQSIGDALLTVLDPERRMTRMAGQPESDSSSRQ